MSTNMCASLAKLSSLFTFSKLDTKRQFCKYFFSQKGMQPEACDECLESMDGAWPADVFGPRIVEVGALGLPDLVEKPFHQLDGVLRQRLPWGLSLSLKGANLLELPATRTLGGRAVDSVNRGRAVSAGLSWTR
jgi:hypothetical protein